MMEEVFVLSAKRTPHGRFGKALSKIPPTKLGGLAIAAAINSSGLGKECIEETVFGNVIQAGNGQNVAGQCSYYAGLGPEVTKNTVNVVCASGTLAIENASREIALGERDVIIAGGTESMSRAPYLLSSNFRAGVKNMFFENEKLQDSMFTDGLRDAFYGNSMGYWADKTSMKYGHNREQIDEFAISSYQKSLVATNKGLFNDELIALPELAVDEGIRETSMESLSKLSPAFSENGLHTAGNSSQISDGASALVLVSGKYLEENNLNPIAKITGFWSSSMDSRDFIEAPIKSTRELLSKKEWKISDFDLFEHNEAFAGGCILLRDQLGIENDRFNVNGGAIAIGHPLGSSGSRIVVTLIHALKNNKMERGLATLCHGGGGGHTITLEVM